MVELFKRSKFFLSVASKMSYDDGIVFTENNIVAYLAELEEHICSLVTYSAFKKDDPNAAISAIPLAQLNHKEFGKRELDVSLRLNVDPICLFRLKHQTLLKSMKTHYLRDNLTSLMKNNTKPTFRKSSLTKRMMSMLTVLMLIQEQMEVEKALRLTKMTKQGKSDCSLDYYSFAYSL